MSVSYSRNKTKSIMSTNSRIAIKMSNGTVRSIYCHWDGYPSNNGDILLNHYKDEKKINELINLGALSCLKERVNPELSELHNFDNCENDCTVAYYRDRGDNKSIDVYTSVTKWAEPENRQEFNYLWKDGAWYFNCSKGKKKYGTLTKLTEYHCSEKTQIY